MDIPLRTVAAFDAVVDVAVTLRLTRLELFSCRVSPASIVALQRLLQVSDALRELVWSSARLHDTNVVPILTESLRSNRSLTSLSLKNASLWRNVDAAAALFGTLTGHAGLTSIAVSSNNAAEAGAAAAAGALLGALVAADAPQLCVLDISYNELGDIGLAPLVDALPHNTHLRELQCDRNAMSAEFARDRLMPALAANTGLRVLASLNAEADAFISARTAAMAAA